MMRALLHWLREPPRAKEKPQVQTADPSRLRVNLSYREVATSL
jgi:hypothetical protein